MFESLSALGAFVRALRRQREFTQVQLAEACGVPRTAVAHLEQGHRLPTGPHLTAIAELLGVPQEAYGPLTQRNAALRLDFESELGELVGRPVTIAELDSSALKAAEAAIGSLIGASLTDAQCFDTFREILVVYGVPPVSKAFFREYFGAASFQSIDTLAASIQGYQTQAIRLFPTFGQAYEALNKARDIDQLLAPLKKRSLEKYTARAPWTRVHHIAENDLKDLGYVAAAQLRAEKTKRDAAVQYLREMSAHLKTHGKGSLQSYRPKKRREIESLLRELASSFIHGPMSPLFSPSAMELESEADRLESLSKQTDQRRVEATQTTGLRNLSSYLAADHLDVYVATSMRVEADFVSVNRFVTDLFDDDQVKPLKLRYFNPTQSWIQDRVAKGLVEALMLRRSSATIYLAQKSDSFGKDSEASVALGQGKPVIVYVPCLTYPERGIDAEGLGRLREDELRSQLRAVDPDQESLTMDAEALLGALIASQLASLSTKMLSEIVHRHWPDFGFKQEAGRVPPNQRDAYLEWLGAIELTDAQDSPPDIPHGLENHVRGIIVALAVTFEKRASLFREKHPLALQVIISTGVLNGILVARSVRSCAKLLREVLENSLHLKLERLGESYRLVEESTGSTVRVISKHRLLANAFASYYERG